MIIEDWNDGNEVRRSQ